MFKNKFYFKNFPIIIITLILITKSSHTQKITQDLLGGWNEKGLTEENPDYIKTKKAAEAYFINEGYSLEENDIIPFAFFKQVVNGVNYRLLYAGKKKSRIVPTIYDINFHKNNDEIKMIHAENPGVNERALTTKEKKEIEVAIIKYYFEKFYTIKEWEIQYEYHKLNGLNDFGIYDMVVELKNKDETVSKRILVVHRNDKTFKVEMELHEE